MASSGLYAFSPKVAELTDEAFERAGLDPAALVARHAKSARRSLNYMAAAWANKGRRQWKGGEATHTVAVDETSFAVDAEVIDVTNVMLRRDGKSTPMIRMSREDYRSIHDRTITGRPHAYFFDRQITPVLHFWWAAENATDVIVYEKFIRIQDITSASETFDVPHRWYDAVCDDLAARLAKKYSPDRYESLKRDADKSFKEAHNEDDDNADLNITVSYGR